MCWRTVKDEQVHVMFSNIAKRFNMKFFTLIIERMKWDEIIDGAI